MNKKILDGAITVLFCMSLIVTSNIQEKDLRKTKTDTEVYAEEQEAAKENGAVTSGVSRVFSGYSFTTESDEEKSIEKKQVIKVAEPESNANDETLTEDYRADTTKTGSENEAVPAGLARAAEPEEAAKSAEAAEAAEQEEAADTAEATEPEDTEVSETFARQTYSNRWNITLTEDEIDLLAGIVWLEARGEPQEGQEAVVEVVFNRMTSGKFPTSLYDVLSQSNPVQFCSWKNRDSAEPTDKEYQSIYQVLQGNTNILRNDTLYFSREPLTSRLDVEIGAHSFCY